MSHGTDECKQIFATLSEYLDLELPPEACRELQAHLAECAPCEAFAESLRKTVALCHEYQANEMPDPISQAARARLQEAWQRALAASKAEGASR
ncbi:MAG TPA: zf-HC2 domain-containing protein [Bryobacteraceae bacterium]|nr:zf-HC2 domain-containing protein [Bryobacteraceae bacterium]